MSTVNETSLPGLGIRFEFTTKEGVRLGVFHRSGGRQDLLVYDRDDPDRCRESISLDDEDARTLTGVSVVAVLRDEQAIPAPGPEQRLEAGDTLVVVGTPRGIERLAVMLRTG